MRINAADLFWPRAAFVIAYLLALILIVPNV